MNKTVVTTLAFLLCLHSDLVPASEGGATRLYTRAGEEIAAGRQQ
jgi:hypothetical protein